jgi:hypothetical protein
MGGDGWRGEEVGCAHLKLREGEHLIEAPVKSSQVKSSQVTYGKETILSRRQRGVVTPWPCGRHRRLRTANGAMRETASEVAQRRAPTAVRG